MNKFTNALDYLGNKFPNKHKPNKIAEWSLILDDDKDTPIIEDQTSPESEFYKMVEYWERKGYEIVICR